MKRRDLNAVFTSSAFLLASLFSTANAQQPRGPIALPSAAHATSRPLKAYGTATHKKPYGPARVIPLLRPEKAGAAAKGGGGIVGAPSTGGSWSDADLQTSYNSSRLTVSNVFPGIGFTALIPPDENLSVGVTSGGTTQIMQVVNTNYAVFSTSGNMIASGDLALNLFGNMTNSVCSSEDGGDPIALFDKLDGRWIVSQLAYNSTFTDNHLCLAISQGSDAAGTYDLYDIPFNSNVPDYPKLAVWPDGIYFSANIFVPQGTALQFTGAQACSLPRTDVTSPPPSGQITFSCSQGKDATIYNILPADLENLPGAIPLPTGPDYYMQYIDNLGPSSGNILRLYRFDPSSGALSTLSDLSVNDFHEACGEGTCIPQEGTTQQLDSIGDRLMYRLSFRAYDNYQQMVVNHAVQINSNSQQTGIRWYTIRSDAGGPFYVDKQSTFSPDVTYYRWMGSIGQNKDGDLGLGYSVSGVTSVPGIAVTGLLNGTDTLMEQEQRMYNGNDQSYQGTYSRWGDYSSISVDPTDDCTFWYTNEYVTPPIFIFDYIWQTEIGKLSFGNCSGSTASTFSLSANSPSSQTVPAGTTGISYSTRVTAASGSSPIVDLTVPSGCPISASNCSISPAQIDFTSTTSPANATLTVDNSGTTPQSYNIVVKGADDSDPTITSQTSVQLAVTDFSLSSNPSSQTVTAGNNASYTITANSLNGFTGTVNLSVGATCPSGMTCAFGSTSISAGGSTTLTVSGTGSVTTSSTFNITVTGTSGSLSHFTGITLTVNPPSAGDFSISASPGNLTLRSGQTGSYTVSVTPSGGFNADVTVSANCPSGFSCSMSNGGLISGGSGSVTYTVTNVSATRGANGTITFDGTGGGKEHQTTSGLKAR